MFSNDNKKDIVESQRNSNFTPSACHLIVSSSPQQLSSFVHSPEHLGIPINYPNSQQQYANQHEHNRQQQPFLSNSLFGHYFDSGDSAVQLSDCADRIVSNEREFQQMNIAANMSPSSSITSVGLCRCSIKIGSGRKYFRLSNM